ncbi:MAG TPA: CAP domain-containing protein, partial [Gaiellaceae bacterium]|nr:CAP domain-containing protein [Gaiellaceae bacterium]
LLALAAAAAALAAPAVARAGGSCTAAPDWPAQEEALAAAVVELTNAHRATLGLAPLRVSPTLGTAAAWKARHMAHHHYLSHDDPAPAPRSFAQRLADCGYGNAAAGENVAMGYPTAQAVLTAWLASEGHRRNIESARFVAIGVGAARSASGQVYWAQNFGGDAGAAAAPPAPAPAPGGSAPSAPASGASVPPAPAPGSSPPSTRPVPTSSSQPVDRLALVVGDGRASIRRDDRVYVSVPSAGEVLLVLRQGRRVVGAARLHVSAGGTTAVAVGSLARTLRRGAYALTATHDGRSVRVAFRVR